MDLDQVSKVGLKKAQIYCQALVATIINQQRLPLQVDGAFLEAPKKIKYS